jgi:hypothetical protein
MSENNVKTFAFIVDGDVIGTLTIPQSAVNSERLWSGLSSNPTVVESTGVDGVTHGWSYDGTNFIPPQG